MSKQHTIKKKFPDKKEPVQQGNKYNKYLIWIPFLFAFILYGNSIPNEFTLDDLPQIVNNKYVQKGLEGIPELLTTNYWAGSGQNLGYYRPLSLITFAVEKALHNNNAMIMHFINVLLYGLTGIFVFALLSLLFRNMPFFVLSITLLFMAHPVHTEVVANIKSRDEILSFLNSVIAVWLVFRFAKNKQMLSLILSWIFYFLALMSKETAMTTLALVPLVLFFFTPKTGNYIGTITVTFAVVSISFLALKAGLIGTLTGDPPNEMNVYPYKDFAGRIPTVLYIFGMYMFRLILPVRLLYDYSYNQIPEASWLNPVVIISLLVLITLVYLAIKGLKRNGIISFAILFFGVTLSVGLAFVITRGGIMAERFLYSPVLGFSIAFNYLLFKLVPHDNKIGSNIFNLRQRSSVLIISAITLLLVGYSVRTVARNPVWKNNFELFSTDIKNGANSALLQKHYGSELINQSVAAKDENIKDSLMKLGIEHVEIALKINPKFSEAHFKLGYAYYQLKDYKKSIEYYKNANQGSSMTLSNMALSYYMLGEYGEASRLLKKSLQLDPDNQTAKQNMPLIQQAFNRKLTAMKNSPSTDPQHFYDLGNLFVEQSNYKEALESFDKATRLRTNFSEAWLNKGNCYYMLQDYNNAIKSFEEVLKYDPGSRNAMKNLSHLYGIIGNTTMQQFYDNKLATNK